MNTNDCDRVRMHLMASMDGEVEQGSSLDADREHLSSCSACQQWLNELAGVTTAIDGLSYARPQRDLWPSVQAQLHRDRQSERMLRWLLPIGVLALAWRALQLFLPLPELVSLVPVIAAVVLVARIGRGLLAIETWAPELRQGDL